jgi:porin
MVPRVSLRFCFATGLLLLAAFLFSNSLLANSVPAAPAQPLVAPCASQAPCGLFNQNYLLGDFKGERLALEDKGVCFTPAYTAEVFGNPSGGAKQGIVHTGLLELQLTLDFQKMAGWDACFHASSYYPMGNNISKGDTNDLFTVSNIAAYNTPHLFELWYDQKFWSDKISLRVGQLAADSEFCINSDSANFLNGTYGWPGIISSNAPTPAYAYATPGIRLRIDPDEHWTIMASVFSGNPAPDRMGDPDPDRTPGNNFDNSGATFNINGHRGLFSVNELWYKLNQEKDATGLPGTYKVGGWFHTDTFSDMRYDDQGISLASPDSDGVPRALDGNNGFYALADQTIWQDKSDCRHVRQINLFCRCGTALGGRSTFDYYGDGGAVFCGLIPCRPNDLFGVATAYGHIGGGAQGLVEDQNNFNGTNQPIPDHEQNIEVTYTAQIAPWWTVQPDLQVILHPGGSSATPDAVVLGCRTVISF